MTTEGSWARHYLEEWQRRSGDRRLPYWLRVTAAAYGSVPDNGHAEFKRGELALILGEPGRPYKNVPRAIEDAVEFGWLGQGSFHRCLIVPIAAVRKGNLDRTPLPCATHRRLRELHTRRGIAEISATPDVENRGAIPHQVSGSEREPFSSDLVPASTDDPQANPSLRVITSDRSAS